jgi:hypothetical protein
LEYSTKCHKRKYTAGKECRPGKLQLGSESLVFSSAMRPEHSTYLYALQFLVYALDTGTGLKTPPLRHQSPVPITTPTIGIVDSAGT